MPSFEPALELSGVRLTWKKHVECQKVNLNKSFLTTFSVSWIRRRAEGEGKFVSLDRLRLLSLVNITISMRKSQEMILKVKIQMTSGR